MNILLVLLLILIVIFVPFVSVWSVNTLFLTTIPYTFETWCAAIILVGILTQSRTK